MQSDDWKTHPLSSEELEVQRSKLRRQVEVFKAINRCCLIGGLLICAMGLTGIFPKIITTFGIISLCASVVFINISKDYDDEYIELGHPDNETRQKLYVALQTSPVALMRYSTIRHTGRVETLSEAKELINLAEREAEIDEFEYAGDEAGEDARLDAKLESLLVMKGPGYEKAP